ncbi:hypothetical protein JOD45_000481 [Scopulibacillus daqui]|uniref:Uncharacterized protein n=1 Tax=Scopulibacillus daqui TaxID=1469162 RepID=A0ABS2PWF2_9BACL|nr:hypothetical protein [Scopulibacillus daqui]
MQMRSRPKAGCDLISSVFFMIVIMLKCKGIDHVNGGETVDLLWTCCHCFND